MSRFLEKCKNKCIEFWNKCDYEGKFLLSVYMFVSFAILILVVLHGLGVF